ncbi:MAG: dihydrodipicolinate synthase family protein [Candidatus Acidiferrales bacterium]
MKLEGLFAALTTPFRSDDSLDLAGLAANIARYNRTDLAGYVVTGSTGEAALLSIDESERVWATVLENAAPGKTALAGTGAETTAESIERTNRAAALGYSAALVRTPSYYKPFMNARVLIEHYHRVADASPIPILLYSVPVFTGVTVEAEVTARLAEHPNIIGIKDSSGSVERAEQTARAVPADFSLLVGSAITLVASLGVGASGGILALASALPEPCAQVYRLARAGKIAEARALEEKLEPASRRIGSGLGPPGLKYAMDRLGYIGGLPRRPLLPPTEQERAEVDAVLAAWVDVPAGARPS